ncbi:MAG TPA: hypothetical protein DCM68_06960 [Verrucomicrobia bacterium]|nr:hypothetical protein [Verrucomicrobiota bacterium]
MEDLVHFTSMDVPKMKALFEKSGFSVRVATFGGLDLGQDFRGKYVVYQTSEKKGPFYKHYVEDVVYWLERHGAICLPPFEHLKAHHNKCYMEMMRRDFKNPELKSLRSWCFGSVEEAVAGMPSQFPVVLKQVAGSGSEGVFLARNPEEYRRHARAISQTALGPGWPAVALEGLKQAIRRGLSPVVAKYRKTDPPVRQPVVVQEFVPNLAGDYKVVVFGGKYYILYRQNREGDFRASGGGRLFVVPEADREGLLDFARKVVEEIDFPMLGLDIAFDGSRYHLFEFQMIHLGPYTLQAAEFWHENRDGKWVQFNGKSDLEVEFCRSLCEHITVHGR